MIDLYSWTTPNGRKVHIMLEETGLDYEAHAVDIRTGAQFEPEFLKISPNNKIPAIVDRDGPEGRPFPLFESGAILFYLAEKTGMLLPAAGEARHRVMEWLMFQMGGVGPMFGQANHFRIYAKEKVPLGRIEYGIERYTNEARRLSAVMDRRLAENEFIAGPDYSIADIAIWPWCLNPERRGIERADFPNLFRWYETVKARPAVQRGMEVLKDAPRAEMDDKAWEIMFGKAQYERH